MALIVAASLSAGCGEQMVRLSDDGGTDAIVPETDDGWPTAAEDLVGGFDPAGDSDRSATQDLEPQGEPALSPPACSAAPLPLDRFAASLRTTAAGRTFAGWGGAHAPGTAQRVPVLFVHGNGGSAQDWIPIRDALCKQGYTDLELWAITFQDHDCTGPCASGSNTEHATELETLVKLVLAQTQATRVNIVAVSMGVPAARYYLKALGGVQRNEVALAYLVSGPNHGLPQCDLPGAALINVACAELCYASLLYGWLYELNHPDETPHGPGDGIAPADTVIYRTVSFTGDPFFLGVYVISPMLDGADNQVINSSQHAAIDLQDLTLYLNKT